MSLHKLPNGAYIELTEIIRIQPFPAIEPGPGETGIAPRVQILSRPGIYTGVEGLESFKAAQELADEIAKEVNEPFSYYDIPL